MRFDLIWFAGWIGLLVGTAMWLPTGVVAEPMVLRHRRATPTSTTTATTTATPTAMPQHGRGGALARIWATLHRPLAQAHTTATALQAQLEDLADMHIADPLAHRLVDHLHRHAPLVRELQMQQAVGHTTARALRPLHRLVGGFERAVWRYGTTPAERNAVVRPVRDAMRQLVRDVIRTNELLAATLFAMEGPAGIQRYLTFALALHGLVYLLPTVLVQGGYMTEEELTRAVLERLYDQQGHD